MSAFRPVTLYRPTTLFRLTLALGVIVTLLFFITKSQAQHLSTLETRTVGERRAEQGIASDGFSFFTSQTLDIYGVPELGWEDITLSRFTLGWQATSHLDVDAKHPGSTKHIGDIAVYGGYVYAPMDLESGNAIARFRASDLGYDRYWDVSFLNASGLAGIAQHHGSLYVVEYESDNNGVSRIFELDLNTPTTRLNTFTIDTRHANGIAFYGDYVYVTWQPLNALTPVEDGRVDIYDLNALSPGDVNTPLAQRTYSTPFDLHAEGLTFFYDQLWVAKGSTVSRLSTSNLPLPPEVQWVGPTLISSPWNGFFNWDGYPTSRTDAVFDIGPTGLVETWHDSNVEVKQLIVRSGDVRIAGGHYEAVAVRVNGGSLAFSSSSVDTPLIKVAAGANFEFGYGGFAEDMLWDNDGTFRIQGAGTFSTDDLEIRNRGIFSVSGGTLVVQGGSSRIDTTTGWFNTTAGGEVRFTGPNYTNIDLNGVFHGGLYHLAGGDVGGNFTFAGASRWTAGYLRSGASMTIGPAGTLTIDGTGVKEWGGTIYNQGTILWTEGDISARSNSSLNIASTGTWRLTGDGDLLDRYGRITITNAGLIHKSVGLGETVFEEALINNSGTVLIQAGTLTMVGGSSGINTSAGQFIVANGATLKFTGPNYANIDLNGVFHGGLYHLAGGYIGGNFTFAGASRWTAGYLRSGASMTIGPAGTLTIDGTGLKEWGGAIQNQGRINLAGGQVGVTSSSARLTNNVGATITVTADTAITRSFSNMTLINHGKIDLRGTDLTVAGSYTQMSTGSYLVGINQLGTGLLAFSGNAVIAGRLGVDLVGGYDMTPGTILTVFTANHITGMFQPDFTMGSYFVQFTVHYATTSVAIELIGVSLTGDANHDGVVDAADLISVERNFGLVGAAGVVLAGDANFDGRVDGDDLIAVERNFGLAFVNGQVVPEPGAGVVVLLMLAWLGWGRRGGGRCGSGGARLAMCM